MNATERMNMGDPGNLTNKGLQNYQVQRQDGHDLNLNHIFFGSFTRNTSLLSGLFPTHLKNMRKSNWIISPNSRGENKKYLKPTSSSL